MRKVTTKGPDGFTEVLTVLDTGTVVFDACPIGFVRRVEDRVSEMRGSVEVGYRTEVRWVAEDADRREVARCSRMSDAAIAVFRALDMED